MTNLFESIDPEKKQRIINAALEEFASKGCKQATTDNIVAKAGISKGALFKYFGSKGALLLYLCDYSYEILSKAYFDSMHKNLTDFFELYSCSVKVKFGIINQYPSLYDFMTMLFTGGTKSTDDWLSKKRMFSREQAVDTMTGFDRTKFKDGLDIDKAVNVVRLTFDSLATEVITKLKMNRENVIIGDIHKECDEYIAFFKELFYKEES